MFRRFFSTLFGKKKSQPTRHAPKTQLGVEVLEGRNMMSANPAFTLTNGNLFNSAISQTKPIDIGVEKFTVVNNTVYDLHTDNTLRSLNNDGSKNTALDHIENFMVAPNGNAVTLDTADCVSINGTVVSCANFTAIAMTPTGALYGLDTADAVLHYMGGGPGCWTPVSCGNITAIATTPQGTMFGLDTAKTVLEYTGGGPGSWEAASCANIVSIAMTPHGALYGLSTANSVMQYHGGGAGGWTTIGVNVTSFQVAPDGSVYALNTVKQLFRYTTQGGVFKQIGSNVASFEVAPDNSVDALNTVKQLFRYTTQSGVFTQIGSNVVSFQVGADNSVYALNTVDQLFTYTPQSGVFTQVAGNVRSFTVNNAGDILVTAFTATPYNDVQQCASATCWLLAPLASAAKEGIDLADRVQYVGNDVFRVGLCNATGGMTYQNVVFDGETTFQDPQGGPESEWVVLYQRAILQQLNMNALQPWHASAALSLLTGKPVEDWYLTSTNFAGMEQALAQHKPVTAGTGTTGVVGHEYAVLAVNFTPGRRPSVSVEVYDPYGELETMSYSDFSKLFTTVSF